MGLGAVIGAMTGSSALDMLGREVGAQRDYKRSRRFRQTQYQDTMADMYKAGLNPILAGKVGGNTSAVLSSSPSNTGKNAVDAGINSAVAKKQLDLFDKQIFKTTQEGNAARALANQRQYENWFLEADKDLRFRRLPAERASADFIGNNPDYSVWNSALSVMSPTANAVGSGVKLIYGPKGTKSGYRPKGPR